MDPFMLHPVPLEMAVLTPVFVVTAGSDINQATRSEQFMNYFNISK